MKENKPEWCIASNCVKFALPSIAEDGCVHCGCYKPTENTEGNGGSTPSQYALPEGATELQDLIEYRDMNFAWGNMFKSCYRLGFKNAPEYELNKIIYFAKRELKRIKKIDKE